MYLSSAVRALPPEELRHEGMERKGMKLESAISRTAVPAPATARNRARKRKEIDCATAAGAASELAPLGDELCAPVAFPSPLSSGSNALDIRRPNHGLASHTTAPLSASPLRLQAHSSKLARRALQLELFIQTLQEDVERVVKARCVREEQLAQDAAKAQAEAAKQAAEFSKAQAKAAQAEAEALAAANRAKRKKAHEVQQKIFEKAKSSLQQSSAQSRLRDHRLEDRESAMLQSLDVAPTSMHRVSAADELSVPQTGGDSLPPMHDTFATSKRQRVLTGAAAAEPSRAKERAKWMAAHPEAQSSKPFNFDLFRERVRASLAAEGGLEEEVSKEPILTDEELVRMSPQDLQQLEEGKLEEWNNFQAKLESHYHELMEMPEWRAAFSQQHSSGTAAAALDSGPPGSMLMDDPCDSHARERYFSAEAVSQRESDWLEWPSGSILRKGIRRMALRAQRPPASLHRARAAAAATPTSLCASPFPSTPQTPSFLNADLLASRSVSQSLSNAALTPRTSHSQESSTHSQSHSRASSQRPASAVARGLQLVQSARQQEATERMAAPSRVVWPPVRSSAKQG
jgi:hypothetical protein